jgi:hypothetical protein
MNQDIDNTKTFSYREGYRRIRLVIFFIGVIGSVFSLYIEYQDYIDEKESVMKRVDRIQRKANITIDEMNSRQRQFIHSIIEDFNFNWESLGWKIFLCLILPNVGLTSIEWIREGFQQKRPYDVMWWLRKKIDLET